MTVVESKLTVLTFIRALNMVLRSHAVACRGVAYCDRMSRNWKKVAPEVAEQLATASTTPESICIST